MFSFLQVFRERLSPRNVLVLRFLFSAAQQDDDLVSVPDEVNAKAGSMMDAQFADAFANGLHIARIPELQTADTRRDAGPGRAVSRSARIQSENSGKALRISIMA